MDGALEPREDLLGFQQSWTSYFFGPRTSSVVCFPLEGLSRPPQEPHVASFSSVQDWVSAQDQQGAKEGEEEGSLGGLELLASWGVGAMFPPLISSLKLLPDFGAISSASLSEESST